MLRTALFVFPALLARCATTTPKNDAPSDAGTGGDAEAGPPDADADAPPGGFELASFPGGFDDGFSLPPGFAPLLPLAGSEATREPPGMYDLTSAELFSYVVLWWLTGTPDLSTSSLRDDLFIYYTGLCGPTTVTLDDPAAPGPNDAGVGLSRVGTVNVESCFGLPIPPPRLEVSTFACPDHDAVVVLVSPQPETAGVWTELRRIQASFRCW